MPKAVNLSSLKPIAEAGAQAYFCNSVQVADILEWVLRQTGPARLTVSTYSTSEEFIRRVCRLKAEGLILSARLFCDLRAARKTLSLYNFISNVFDKVCLCENHSKVLLFEAAGQNVVVITSQNQTRGDRYECGVISAMADIASQIRLAFDELETKSNPLNELLRTDTGRN